MSKGRGEDSGRSRRTWPQRLLLGFNSLLVVVCLLAAAGLSLVKVKLQDVSTVVIDSAGAPVVEASEPRNILIVGTDSGKNLDEEDPINNGRDDGKRADVIMIMRIDPSDGTARLLSIPRDSRVEIAPRGYNDRINAALYGVEGEKNLIDTIKNNFGISIDNYVEIDFAAFQELVEQLDGVPVYFAAPVRDKKSGLFISEAGCHLLGPSEALAYARSRNFQFSDDGRWRYDQTGDLGRISRQQDFMKRAVRRASDKGIRNPSTALGIVNAAKDAAVIDESLSVGVILELLSVFRTFNPDELKTDQVPTYAAPRDGVQYQDVDWEDANVLLEPFWGLPDGEEISESSIIVSVQGSSRIEETLGLVSINLDQLGFDADASTQRYGQSDTSITFGPAGFQAALKLATYVEGGLELDYDDDIVGPKVELTIGDDFGGIRSEPIAIEELPSYLLEPPEELQDRIANLNSSTESTDSGTADSDTTDPEDLSGEATTTEPGNDVTTTEIPSEDDSLGFLLDSEADGAPPGIVPTDPEMAAACH